MSYHADRGTAAHAVLEECLTSIYTLGFSDKARDYIGREIRIEDYPHNALSPSGAKRWMNCSASPRLEGLVPERVEDHCRSIVFDEEDAVAVQLCIDYVAERVASLSARFGEDKVQVHTERRVSLKRFVGSDVCDGTSDIAIIVSDKYCEHVDYKHGAGVPVAVDDPQNALYMLGTCAMIMDEADATLEEPLGGIPFVEGRLTIVQPRCDKVEPRIRWRDIERFSTWFGETVVEVQLAVQRTKDPSIPPTPSDDACRWCSAKGACEAYQGWALDAAGVLPDYKGPGTLAGTDIVGAAMSYAQRDIELLDGVTLAAILEAREILKGAMDAAAAYALQLTIDGTAPPEITAGWKLVHGRTQRRWGIQDEEELVKRIKALKIEDPDTRKRRALKKGELYQQKLRSVAQLEKTFKSFGLTETAWSAFRELVDKPEGALSLVPRTQSGDEVRSGRTGADDALSDLPDDVGILT